MSIIGYPKTLVRRWRYAGLAGIILGYSAIVQLSTYLFYQGRSAPAVVLTADGFLLAILIIYGWRMWPVIPVAVFANGLYLERPVMLLAIAAVGSTLQALAGYFILRKFDFDFRIGRLRDVMSIVGVAIVVTSIRPVFAALAKMAIGINTPVDWRLVWLGAVLNILIITPLILRLFADRRLSKTGAKKFETVMAFIGLFAVNFIIFFTPTSSFKGLPLIIPHLLLLSWVALRMGTVRMTVVLFATAVMGLAGPFLGNFDLSSEELVERIISTQIYLIIFSILFYFITAITEERDKANEQIKDKIRDLEAALKQIREDAIRKDEFLAVLAHELRNPLAPIVNYMQIMELDGVDGTKFKDAKDGIRQQVGNISRILEDLLDISRITRGKINLKMESVDARDVVMRSVACVRPLIEQKKQYLTIDLPDRALWLFADPIRAEQIMINLLNNAAKYSPPESSIKIYAGADGGTVSMGVKDNGIGIAPEVIPHIFEIFRQADSSITRQEGGLGIGLSLVRSLVQMHNGTISAESEGLGKGSDFRVKFPLHDGGSVSSEKKAKENMEPVPSGRKVLVVDDNQDILSTFALLLKMLGYDTTTAVSGPEALKRVSEHRFDAIFLDIGLPGMSGYDVANILRKEMNISSLLVAISGYGQKEDKQKAHDAGFDHHLTKPVEISEIEYLLKSLKKKKIENSVRP